MELIFLATFLSAFIQILHSNNEQYGNEINDSIYSTTLLPKISIDPPIYIDDRDPNYNWSKTAAENEWLSGSGTSGDPYVISNLTINGYGGNCIEIKDSEYSNFVIKDSILFNGSSGIYLDNTRYGYLDNNLFFNNSIAGINLFDCVYSYTVIINNTMINNFGHGILLRVSLYNEIISNNIHYNGGNGISLYSFSDYNNVENNEITYNQHGIRLYYGSRFTIILNNTIEHNSMHGIYVYQDCEYTDILNNRISFNGQDGIQMLLRSHGFIQYNILDSNTNYGMYIRNAYFRSSHVSFNTITNSSTGIFIWFLTYANILNNDIYEIDGVSIHVIDSDNNMISNNHLVGYGQCILEVASNGNTITNNLCGEDLFEENDNFNNAKLVPKGWTRYLAANDEDWFYTYLNKGDTLYLTLQFLNSSGNLDLSLYNDQNILLKSSTSETDNELIIQNISTGAFYFFRVYNDVNNIYSLNIESEDIFAPSIKIVAPIENELFRSVPPQFIVEVYDLNLETTWYTVNDSQAVIFTFNESINAAIWNALPDGDTILKFFANDSTGNTNMKSVIVEKSATPPTIIINNPLNNHVYNQSVLNFNVQILDKNLLDMWYVVSNISFQSEKIFFTDNGTIGIWDYFTDGQLNITFFANDTAGNINSSTVLIYKDTLSPRLWINTPYTNQLFGRDAPHYNINFTEANPILFWYTLNSNASKFFFSNNSGYIDEEAWDLYPNGTVIIRFYIQDVAGWVVSEELQVLKDLTPPNIYFTYAPPFRNYTQPQYYHDWIQIVCIAFDQSGIKKVTLWDDSQDHRTDLDFSLLSLITGTFLVERPMVNIYNNTWVYTLHISNLNWSDKVNFFFIAEDSVGNLNSTQFYNFTIGDDRKPQTTISFSPNTDSNIFFPSTLFSLNIDDDHGSGVSMIKFRINNSVWFDYVGPFDLAGFSFGSHEISYYSVDNAGNKEDVQTLIITLIDPESQFITNNIPSFIPLSIIIIITIFILFATHRIKKNSIKSL